MRLVGGMMSLQTFRTRGRVRVTIPRRVRFHSLRISVDMATCSELPPCRRWRALRPRRLKCGILEFPKAVVDPHGVDLILKPAAPPRAAMARRWGVRGGWPAPFRATAACQQGAAAESRA